jgi:two-component system, LytTR family, sensor histidine kinase AlgZ
MIRSAVMARTESLLTAVLRTLAIGMGLGVIVSAIFTASNGWHHFGQSWVISVMYSLSIGVPAKLVFSAVGPRLHSRTGRFQWLTYLGLLLVMIALGSLVTGLANVAIGWLDLEDFWAAYFFGFKIALAIAVPCVIGAMSFARLHRRLDERDAQLAAIERDRERALALAAEARLASLESRTRPHFLFNALNSAIALIPDEPVRAEEVLERLAGLLRSSLDAEHGLIALGDELRTVTDYLEIERVRFGDRLRYEVDVPAELAAVQLPAFAIQTLVENSVKYAVSAATTGATIRVRARRANGRVAIEISDDGPGFKGEVWLAGHGLDGLRARLAALHGDAARLVAPAPAARGAMVVIELPAAPAHAIEAA